MACGGPLRDCRCRMCRGLRSSWHSCAACHMTKPHTRFHKTFLRKGDTAWQCMRDSAELRFRCGPAPHLFPWNASQLISNEASRQTHQATSGQKDRLGNHTLVSQHSLTHSFPPTRSSSAMEGVMMDASAEGQEFQPHGAFLGHIVPGSMFIIWGAWWAFSSVRIYLLSTPQRPYKSRAWFELPILTSVPLEPIIKVLGCFIGINGELWFGQNDWYTNMFNADGTFNEGHMNNWQHAAMYFAYMISGFVDIVGFYTELPPDSEQAALGIAFVTEGLLLGFHLKGAPIEVLVHKILVLTIAGSAVVMFAEICYKGSVILTLARALLVLLQGIWFIQIGYILFKDIPAWDAHSMNSVMMAPALYCLDIMLLTLGSLTGFLLLRLVYCKAPAYTQLDQDEDGEDPRGPNSIFPRFTEPSTDQRNGDHKIVQLASTKRAQP